MNKIILLYGILISTDGIAGTESPFESLIRRGQKAAYEMIEATGPDVLQTAFLKEPEAAEAVANFYTEANFNALLTEAGTSEIEFVQANANGACGQTLQQPAAKISLSLERCLVDLTSVAAVARLLIGEYVHHLGHGDEFTDWVKLAVVSTFEKTNPVLYSRLSQLENPYAPDLTGDLKGLLGNVYLTNSRESPELFMIDHRGTIHFTAPKKLSDTVDLIMITVGPIHWDAGNKAFYTTGVWHVTGYENRYWGQGLYERYPVWFQRNFRAEFQVIQSGRGVLLKYDIPARVDLQRNDIVMKSVTKSYLRQPDREVIDAYFQSKN